MMKTYLKRAFQLSDSGVKGLAKSIWSFFLYYVSFVPPMICVFLFADRLLNGNTGKPVVYLLFMLAATLVMYLVINYNYKTTYDETYQESANLRIDLAEQLSKLPLSYFSKHNLSDLAQTIMADVASIEHAFANAVANSIGFAIYFLVISVALLIMNWKLDLCVLLPVLTSASVLFLTKKLQVRDVNKHYDNDPLVREAVSYAVNQQELETSVFDGLETAAETLFPNEKPNCGVEVKTYPTDMEKAKQLMKEAGYEDTNDDGILEKDGTSLAIHFNYSQSLASVDNAVLSIAASLKELGFDVTIDAVDMNTWYGALMAGEYDLTFYNTAGGSFDPATDMSNMAPGAMGDPILCQFSAFFENPEIFAELDSTSDSRRVQEIYGMILNGIADQNLLVPVTGTHDLALWNTDKITGYDFYTDASYVDIASVHVK